MSKRVLGNRQASRPMQDARAVRPTASVAAARPQVGRQKSRSTGR
jgi:hypothetical protein